MGKKDKGPVSIFAGIVLSMIGGALIVLSFPKFYLWPLGWLGLTPLVFSIKNRRFWSAFFLGMVTGIVTNVGGFYWIGGLLEEFGHLPTPVAYLLMFLLNIYQALTFAFASGVSASIKQKAQKLPLFLIFSLAFTGFEFILPFIFPWFLADGQLQFTPFIQGVDLFGVSGATFVMVWFSAGLGEILFDFIRTRHLSVTKLAVVLTLPLLFTGYGAVRMQEIRTLMDKAQKYKVGLVEPDVGVWEKEVRGPDGRPLPTPVQKLISHRTLLRLQYLSAKLEREFHPSLIIWPESGYVPWWKVFSRTTKDFAIAAGDVGTAVSVDYHGKVKQVNGQLSSLSTRVYAMAAGPDGMLAVGGASGRLLLRGPEGWMPSLTGNDRAVRGVALDPSGERVVAVGDGGSAFLFYNGRWKSLSVPTAETLRSVVYAGGGVFFAAGDKGVILTIKGERVRLLSVRAPFDVYGLALKPGVGLIMAGGGGRIAVLHKGHVKAWDSRTTRDLYGVYAGAFIYAVGAKGTVLKCDQGSCIQLNTHTRADLYAVSGTQDVDYVYVVGRRGTILRIRNNKVERLQSPVKTDLYAVAAVPWHIGYPFPDNVKFIYRSHSPLPPMSSVKEAMKAAKQDKVPQEDWCSPLRGFHTNLFFGVITTSTQGNTRKAYNAALLTDPDGEVLGSYKKVHLLPFGEYLPLEKEFPFLRGMFPAAGNLSPGQSLEVMKVGKVRFGPLICYEGMLPSLVRDVVDKGVDFLVNITNDSWFGKTAEPYQHLQLAALRAVEHHTYMVRVTSTGISAVVDPLGHIEHMTSLEDPEAFGATIRLMRVHTLYQDVGDVVPWTSLAITLLLWFLPLPGARQKKAARPRPKKKKGSKKNA